VFSGLAEAWEVLEIRGVVRLSTKKDNSGRDSMNFRSHFGSAQGIVDSSCISDQNCIGGAKGEIAYAFWEDQSRGDML